MKRAHRILLILILVISSLWTEETKATHVIGGEVYYQCLNPAIGSYLFTVKLYRDCYTGVPPFDDPIFVSIYDSLGNLFIQMNMDLPPNRNAALSDELYLTASPKLVSAEAFCNIINALGRISHSLVTVNEPPN